MSFIAPRGVCGLLVICVCGSPGSHQGADAGTLGDSGGPGDDGGGRTGDGGTGPGVAMMCPGPGSPKRNGMGCGTERWDIKTGTDSQASQISLVPQPNTIAALVALPAAGGGTTREMPTETTVWQLSNVTLTELKEESDSDYHMVLSDGSKTLIAEIPAPSCTTTSGWKCFVSRARSEVDAAYAVTTTPIYPAATVTVRGVGFFDYPHGQNGVAPNAIELHPVLEVCFGKDCTPD